MRILRGADRPFALIGAWAGGGAILGSDPLRVARPGEDLFALLDEVPEVDAAAGAVGGGWVGYLGFEARHRVEPGHPPPPRPVPLPDGALAYYDHVLHLDAAGRWWFEALVTPGRGRSSRAAARSSRRGSPGRRSPLPFATSGWAWTPSPAGHAEAVRRAAPHRGRRPVPGQPLPAARGAPRRRRARPLRQGRPRAPDRPLRVRRRALGHRREPLAGAVPDPPRARGAQRADQGHPAGARPRRAGGVGEGPRRERDDRRPGAQRPRAGLRAGQRAGHGAGRGPAARRACGTWSRRSRACCATAWATAGCCARRSRPAPSPGRRSSPRST